MKKALLLVPVFFVMGFIVQAQKTQSLKKIIELKMPKTEDDDMPGKRGASVAWHPVQKKYYAVFAGNTDYPLAVFDSKGKRLSDDDQTALIDVRGLWYNPVTKLVSGNGYNEMGWFTYKLDSKGIPSNAEEIHEGMNQPNEQSVGAYNAATKQILFVRGSQVYFYGSDAEAKDSMMIHWSRKKADGPADDEDQMEANEDYNSTTLVYTGIKGQELGFLNITNKEIDLYDIKTGFLSKTLSLPETATAESMFNFAYANGSTGSSIWN